MILSRLWYMLLGIAVAVAAYVVYLAVGQYDRQGTRSLKEGLASDSQTVEWALKIDARRRLDALLVGSVDAALQQALVTANGAKAGTCTGSSMPCLAKVPEAAKTGARTALTAINNAIPADWRDDALFAVDRDGQIVAAQGFDLAGNEDFELGGYPAVYDALHGWLRDDVWMLGSKMYVVVARPVEYDASQRPAGAIVGLKEVNQRFAADLAKRTRTAVAFFASGDRVAGGVGVEGFDVEKLDALRPDLAKVDDKTYGDGGRSEVRMLTDDLGAMYARIPGDVWSLGGGFAVMRGRTPLGGPLGFVHNADDKDKASVPWGLLVGLGLAAGLLGILLSVVEHSLPLRELATQAARFKAGAVDGLQVARFRGAYRLAAQEINQGMERVIEKAGGVTRKPADLESIIGPVPAQPAMSAFSFPGPDAASQAPAPAPFPPPPGPPPASAPTFGAAPPPRPPPAHAPAPPPAPLQMPTVPAAFTPPEVPQTASRPDLPPMRPPAASRPKIPPPAPGRALTGSGMTPVAARPAPAPLPQPEEEEEATTIGAVPAELLAQATGEHRSMDDGADWLSVYEDFVRTKKQCGEPIEGLTFEKFSHTLKKNRDALIQRHGCKRVKFSVYVKEGRASLKATPVKD